MATRPPSRHRTAPPAQKTQPARPTQPRVYRQQLRAQQADANTDRIVAAGVTLIKTSRRLADITLDEVARASGVTVRTILRRFGSRDGVLEAAFLPLKTEVKNLRVETPPGDVDAAITSVLTQYEQIGDFNIRALEAEDQLALVHRGLELGRQSHREWLESAFAPQLEALRGREREARLVALYAATDIYLWKLLRRDLKRSREETHDTMCRLVRGVVSARK
jgi:AcrR family transcriptional regulator